ncbi:MAG: carboxypeptidase regulatory-like domain-containing protein, partial [Janthinobacterium lividum]
MSYRRDTLHKLLLATASITLATSAVSAQSNQGQIAGDVLDTSGAVIAGAKITAKNEATGSVYNATSTSSGSYRFPSIELGRYTLTVAAPGFSQQVNTGVEVRVQTVTSFDLHLAAGSTNETVTVDADVPAVETQTSEAGGTVTDQQIIELPLALGGVGAMRSPESFVFLIPGTAGPGTGNSNNGIFISKIGGGQNFGNEVLLDGASQTRSENGSSFDEEALSVEAISEFKVTTSTPSAEFGRTTGGIENFVTKTGTNKYHGSVFGIFRNEFLDANDWFANGRKAYYNSIGNTAAANANRRPADKQYDFGISAGGPLSIPHLYNGKDRTFAFFSWEQYRLTSGGVAISSLPTLAERGGDFSDRLVTGANGQINPCDGTAIQNGQIFDPATTQTVNGIRCRTAFPGNRIPSSRFSAVGQAIAAYYPTPTDPTALSNNYSLASASSLFNTTYTIRVDHNLGTKDKLFGSYSSRENTRDNPTNLTLPYPVDPNVQTQDFITHFGRAGWDHIFTSNILNHVNLGYNRSNSINGAIEASGNENFNPQLGTPFATGFPRVNVDGYQALSRNQNGDNVDNGIRVNDAVSWQKGRNSFRFGIDYRYQQYSPLAHDVDNGLINFTVADTKATQTGAYLNGTGNGFASMLLGLGDYAQSTDPGHFQPRWISNYWAGFAQ